MFCAIHDRLSDPNIRRIISHCLFDNSSEGIDKALSKYEGEQFYGWIKEGEPMGICGFRVIQDRVEVCHIAVAENARGCGYGSAMIAALRDKYKMKIEAETDDDAVSFYRKCGFETTDFQKHNVRRWSCVLSAPILFNNETDEERRARIYPIILSEYNPAWPEWYAEEKSYLEQLIGVENIARISHFGSTSVPGLLAKPTVDILLEIKESMDIEELIALMPDEYICLRREGNSLSEFDRMMIIKGYTDTGFADKVFHIHVRTPGDNPHSGEWDELYFRDYLIAHPEVAAKYADLKRRLFKDYEHNRDGYTAAKGEFIKEVTKKAKERA